MKQKKIFFNKTINKSEIKNLVNWYIYNFGSLRAQKLIDELKIIGFKYATNIGISLNLEDLKIPKIKENILENTDRKVKLISKKYEKGKISEIKRLEKINKEWNNANEILKNEIILNYRQSNLLNPLYIMSLSGARGNISQIKQIIGMRGLMSDSQGEIINLVITSNFKEGLNIIEYFISCYGARKGLVDTALKTANSGYLTRRLIYSSQSQIITQQNCYTQYKKLITISTKNKEKYKETKENLIGNIIAKDIINENNEIIAKSGQDICNVRFENRSLMSHLSYIKISTNLISNKFQNCK